MKKIGVLFLILFSLSNLHALPWVDDAFLLVETENLNKIRRAIETDYSFKNFTRTSEKENLLMAALKYSRENDVIKALLDDAGISPDSKTKSHVTALMYACQYETDIDAIKSVLFKNANSDTKKAKRILETDKEGQNSVDYARKNEIISRDVIDLLLLYTLEPEKEELAQAQEEATTETALPVSATEEAPAEPETNIETTESEPVESAPAPENVEPASEEAPSINDSLFDFSSVTVPTVIPDSIFLYDYADDKYATLLIPEALIAAESAKHLFIANANERDVKGRTKLMIAAKKGDIARIEDLLYSGAEINAKDEEGWTALMYAARFQKNSDVTTLLLMKGADRKLKNNYGLTPLLLASAYSESPSVLSALLETYPSDSDDVREALAYGISNYNKPSVLQAFIEKNVPVNVPYNGKTPLMVACETNRNTKIIEWLLDNGASKYQIEASSGKTAYDYAKQNRKLPHNTVYWSLNPNS